MARGSAVFFFLVCFLLSARTAHSAESAEMTALDSAGSPLPPNLMSFSLTLDKRTLTFTETFGSKCPPGAYCILGVGQTIREFRIIRRGLDRCGSTRYVAEWRDKKARARMELADHRNRMCKDLRRYDWEMNLRESDAKPRYFGGFPKAPANDCSKIGSDVACIMLYAPSTCSVSSIDGKPLREPISATGGNSCMAANSLKKAICEAGHRWQDVDDSEVSCELDQNVAIACPAIMCAAPPSGCHYQPDPNPTRDENGCALSCGVLACGSGGPDIAFPEQP